MTFIILFIIRHITFIFHLFVFSYPLFLIAIFHLLFLNHLLLFIVIHNALFALVINVIFFCFLVTPDLTYFLDLFFSSLVTHISLQTLFIFHLINAIINLLLSYEHFFLDDHLPIKFFHLVYLFHLYYTYFILTCIRLSCQGFLLASSLIIDIFLSTTQALIAFTLNFVVFIHISDQIKLHYLKPGYTSPYSSKGSRKLIFYTNYIN